MCALHAKVLNVIKGFENQTFCTFYVIYHFNIDVKLNKVSLALYPVWLPILTTAIS